MHDDELIIFNGVNGSTGEYLFDSVTIEGVAKVSKGEKLESDDFQYIRAVDDQRLQPHFGVAGGEEIARDVTKAGWGRAFKVIN